MRICLVASSRFPVREPFAGGLEAQTAGLAAGLSARGHDVTLFAAAGSASPGPGTVRHLPARSFTPSDAARADVGAGSQEWMGEHHAYLGLMLDLAREGASRFDVVHNNSLHHLPVAMSGLLDVPLVTTLHTPPLPWLESAIAYAGERAVFTAVSAATARAWWRVVPAKVVPNGVDVDRWRPGPGGGRAVWAGRVVPEKAPHLAVRAARAAGLAIDVAGPVHDRQYHRDVLVPELGPDARYVGHLTSADVADLVGRAAVAIVSPAWDEPYGLVAAEAMACGTPVASFARGGLVELATPRAMVLARPDDVDDLARAVRVAADLDRGEVRDHAVRNCSIEAMVRGYERVYAAATVPHRDAA